MAEDLISQLNSLREIAKEFETKLQCNCDLDNWQPERGTQHSCVCRIHKSAMMRYHELRRAS